MGKYILVALAECPHNMDVPPIRLPDDLTAAQAAALMQGWRDHSSRALGKMRTYFDAWGLPYCSAAKSGRKRYYPVIQVQRCAAARLRAA